MRMQVGLQHTTDEIVDERASIGVVEEPAQRDDELRTDGVGCADAVERVVAARGNLEGFGEQSAK